MKRPLIILTLCAVCVLACSGCNSSKPVEVPKTLKITAELPEEYPEEVTVYTLSWYDVNEQTAVDAFMLDSSPERIFDNTNSASGPQYRGATGGGEEVLNLTNQKIHGGMNYAYHVPEWEERTPEAWRGNPQNNRLRKQLSWEFVHGDSTTRLFGNEQMEAGFEEDLSFRPYADVLAELEEKMDACGFPEREMLAGEAYTASTLNKNRDIYNRAAKEMDRETLPNTFTGDDEFYYFDFRVALDGIPFCNTGWTESGYGKSGSPTIIAVYNQDGLVDFRAISLCKPGEALSTEPIISPEEALAVYVEEYSKAIHFENTELLSVELNYLITADSKGIYARPAWVLTTVTLVPAGTIENQDRDINEYEVTAVGAYSGVILERETDMR